MKGIERSAHAPKYVRHSTASTLCTPRSTILFSRKSMATHSRRIPSKCPKALLFDLDNTLIATRQGDKAACDKVIFQ